MQIAEVIPMISIFDLEKLSGLLKDFYEISHIRITVFDENLTELVSYPERVAPYCAVIRGTSKGFDACMACDRQACEKAAKKHSTYIYRCHAGLTEAVTPLYVGDVLVGYILFGHVFSYPSHEEGWAVVEQRCADLRVNMRMLKDTIFSAALIEENYIRSAAQILHAVASYLILERMATLKEDLLAARLDAYLSAHYSEKIKAPMIAEYLGIGKTQLYELSKQLYGCGIAERIRALRMEKAKALLREQKKLTLSEIAALCGYSDYNYFITVFSRETGWSPGDFRKKHSTPSF
ncbi:MAG: PocR ligand-binding domain-containing protein [Oscillospiraceae bacterium]|nr:PocR ligand-binding domain-containing protein [Oscillospiraceae bacterium]MBP5239694.1 PocR ligand-binding domain-containing protein [Oscillospiraceae bacterium]